jgi:rfaE bifunctional protein kinase chain/domain
MLDRYLYEEVARISPEAPVPVVLIKREENRLGGAANVALNLKSIGGQVTIMSMVGADHAALAVRSLLDAHGIISVLGEDPKMSTIVKLRIIGRSQQMIRIDFEKKARSRNIRCTPLQSFGDSTRA